MQSKCRYRLRSAFAIFSPRTARATPTPRTARATPTKASFKAAASVPTLYPASCHNQETLQYLRVSAVHLNCDHCAPLQGPSHARKQRMHISRSRGLSGNGRAIVSCTGGEPSNCRHLPLPTQPVTFNSVRPSFVAESVTIQLRRVSLGSSIASIHAAHHGSYQCHSDMSFGT
jgi:hypothetical protein